MLSNFLQKKGKLRSRCYRISLIDSSRICRGVNECNIYLIFWCAWNRLFKSIQIDKDNLDHLGAFVSSLWISASSDQENPFIPHKIRFFIITHQIIFSNNISRHFNSIILITNKLQALTSDRQDWTHFYSHLMMLFREQRWSKWLVSILWTDISFSFLVKTRISLISLKCEQMNEMYNVHLMNL